MLSEAAQRRSQNIFSKVLIGFRDTLKRSISQVSARFRSGLLLMHQHHGYGCVSKQTPMS
jgi:hypothetical protein